MRLPKEYYSLKEVADQRDCTISDQRDCTVDDLLHYAEIGKLEICVYVESAKYEVGKTWQEAVNKEKEYFSGGPCPIWLAPEEWRNLRIYGDQPRSISIKHPQKEAYIFPVERDYAISELIVTHKEKLRFKAACDMARSDDIGQRERVTWLKIIYLLMRKLANHQSSLVKKSDVKMSELEKVLKKAAKDHSLTDKGLSDSKLSEIYNEAVRVLMPDPPPLFKKITK